MVAVSYVGTSKSEIKLLTDSDPAVATIKNQRECGLNISFDWMRQNFGADRSVHSSLDRGRAVLNSPDQLDQYLYSHGLMIKSQWSSFLATVSLSDQFDRVIDYGCGQGIAGLLVAEFTGANIFGKATRAVLVEASSVALARAKEVYRYLCPRGEVILVNKSFDEVREIDLSPASNGSSLHIFSNVLDIGGYNHLRLLGQGLSVGRHTIVAVSHDRDHAGGSSRFRSLETALKSPDLAAQIAILDSDVKQFACDNLSKSAAISWVCRLEVRDE